MSERSTVTASRPRDLVIFAALLTCLLALAPRLIVYARPAQLGTTRVDLRVVAPNGDNTTVRAPESLQGHTLRDAITRIEAFAATPEGRAMVPPGGRLEWQLNYTVQFPHSPHPRRRHLTTRAAPSSP
jgi:hypothetical protein